MAEKEWSVAIDSSTCINCGICMDVCPQRSLDMTRARGVGAEASFARDQEDWPGHDWMMALPIQVAHCNGCTICVRECPTEAVSIHLATGEPAFAPRQGPILVEPDGEHSRGWMPLSAYTRAAMKLQEPREPHDPWGREPRWRISKRVAPWQVWRGWTRK